jgi:acyl-CoA thioester hydrolase
VSEARLTYRGTVYPWHCDHMGHMNVMWYVGKFDEATWQLFSAIGLSPSYLRDTGRGMAAVEQTIAYKRELHAGDIVSVHSRIIEIKDKALRFEHEMRRDDTGEIAATTILTALHLDANARRACSFSDEIRQRAGALSANG